MPETLLETINVVKSFGVRKGFFGRKAGFDSRRRRQPEDQQG